MNNERDRFEEAKTLSIMKWKDLHVNLKNVFNEMRRKCVFCKTYVAEECPLLKIEMYGKPVCDSCTGEDGYHSELIKDAEYLIDCTRSLLSKLETMEYPEEKKLKTYTVQFSMTGNVTVEAYTPDEAVEKAGKTDLGQHVDDSEVIGVWEEEG